MYSIFSQNLEIDFNEHDSDTDNKQVVAENVCLRFMS